MAGRTDSRLLDEFGNHRARGKTVAEAAKLMKVSERTGWRWNAHLELRDRNPDARADRAAGKPSKKRARAHKPESAKIPGVPPDPNPPTWSEEVEQAQAQVAEVEAEYEEPQLPFDLDSLAAISDGPPDNDYVESRQFQADKRIAQDPTGRVPPEANHRSIVNADTHVETEGVVRHLGWDDMSAPYDPGGTRALEQKGIHAFRFEPHQGLQRPNPRFASRGAVEEFNRQHRVRRKSAVSMQGERALLYGPGGRNHPGHQASRSQDPNVRASLAAWDRRSRENAGAELQRLERDRRLRGGP